MHLYNLCNWKVTENQCWKRGDTISLVVIVKYLNDVFMSISFLWLPGTCYLFAAFISYCECYTSDARSVMSLHLNLVSDVTSSAAAGFGRHGMPPPVCNPDLWPFDLETEVWVAYKVGNLHSKFGNASPLGSRVIRYVCDGQTDKWTKATLIAHFPAVGGVLMLHRLLSE